jgi:hypothetical protein
VGFFDSGPKISQGQTWLSQQICNPFALVIADVYPLTRRWDRGRFPTKEALVAAGCPSRCQPTQISINPETAQGSVTYDVNQYIRHANSFFNPEIKPYDIGFSLQGCNARDFGYNYLCVDPTKSSISGNGAQKPVQITQYFHCSNGGAVAGGCNDMSPPIEQLQNFRLIGLPARCHILLWKTKPVTASVKPDFSFDIDFK